jgi:hypothetical protein
MNRLFALMLVAGCGGGSKPVAGQPAAFVQPNTLDATTKKPANLGCLGTHMDPAAPTAATMVTLTVEDFQNKTPVMGATVEVYQTLDKFNAKTPDATSTATDKNGNAMLMVPAGSYRVIFRTTADPSTTVETIEFNRAYNDPLRYSVSADTKSQIPPVIGVIPDDTKGVVAGSQRDCDEKEIGGVTVVTSANGYDSSSNTFYFIDQGSSTGIQTLPSKAQKFTSGNGVFASLNVPPGNATVTASGLLTDGGALTMLGTGVVPVRAGAITILQLEPK